MPPDSLHAELAALPLVAAGYLLVMPQPRPVWADARLQPDMIFSLSEELCPRFPLPQALAWVQVTPQDRSDYYAALGLQAERHTEATQWATAAFETVFGWPGVFYSLAGAVAARATFGLQARAVGVGLPAALASEFIAATAPPPPQSGYGPNGASGFYQTAQSRRPLETGGALLGFELLNVHAGQLNDSWIANGLDRHCADKLGIKTNVHGLLPDLAAALDCLDEIDRAEVGAEPGPWFPVGLVEY